MSHITNTTAITNGLRVGSQTPLDDRLIFSDLTDLQAYGVGDQECYRYYEGMRCWVLSESKEYIWREKSGSEIGAAVDFTYPGSIISQGISYGGRTFNWFESGFVDIDLLRDTVKNWEPNKYYLINETIVAIDPTTGIKTIYRKLASGDSGAVWDATEALLWEPLSNLTSFNVKKYTANHAFTAGLPLTINHNLNEEDILISLKDFGGVIADVDTIGNFTANSVDITSSITATFRVIIIG